MTDAESSRRATLAALAARAAVADRAAFDDLHRRLGGALVAALHRKGLDHAAAEDIAQRAWAAAWDACAARRYDPARSAFTTFLYAIAHNQRITLLRALGRADAPPHPAPTHPHSPDLASALAESVDLVRAVLRGEVGDFSDAERLALRLSSDGQGDRDIALRLGVAPSTANATKQAAYAKLRRELARKGLADSPERPAPAREHH